MIGSGELRKGITIELYGKLYQVISLQRIKMKRTALVRLKLHDIQDGHTIEQTFQNTEKFVQARLDYQRMQYLYNDGALYYFMVHAVLCSTLWRLRCFVVLYGACGAL